MGADSTAAPRDGALRWRLWAFVPAIVGAAFSMNRDIT